MTAANPPAARVLPACRAGRGGLTLVELVLAFLILAVTILVMVERKNAAVISATSIYDRQVATLLADTKLNELLLEGRFLEVDSYNEEGTFEDSPGYTWSFIAEKVYLKSRFAPVEDPFASPSETIPPEGTVLPEGEEPEDGTVPVYRVSVTVTYSLAASGDAEAAESGDIGMTRKVILATCVPPMKIGAEAEAEASPSASPSPSPSPDGGGGP